MPQILRRHPNTPSSKVVNPPPEGYVGDLSVDLPTLASDYAMISRIAFHPHFRLWSLLALTLVWALLYLPHLRTSPGWYGDETLTLMIGKSVFAGNVADRALTATFWHPSYAYQPGYAWLVGAASMAFQGDIVGARLLNAVLAYAIALLFVFGGVRVFGWTTSLFAAALFLTYSQTIIHFRWIYPHNLVAFGFLLTALFLLRKASPKSDFSAGLGLGLAALSHPLFAHGAIAAWACRLKRPVSWIRLAVFPALALAATLGWTWLRLNPKPWLWEDILALGSFYNQFSQDNGSGLQSARNIFFFYSQDAFHLGAFVCALLCIRKRFYAIPVFLAVVSVLLLQNRQNLPVFYYQAVVFLPILALAYAGGIRHLEVRLRAAFGSRARAVPLFALILPAYLFVLNLPPSLSGTLVPRNQHWVTQSTQEVEAAARWINEHSVPTDLVVCHQNIGWLLRPKTTDLMQATAWSGRPTFTFEKLPEKARFLFPADLLAARYLVLGDIDQRWTLAQPNVDWIVNVLTQEHWPVVWRGEFYLIAANPRFETLKP